MRTLLSGLLAAALLTACGGGPASTQPGGASPGGQTPATQATAAAQMTPQGNEPAPPGGGGQVVAVTLTGGEDAGSHTGAGEPNCTYGIAGTNVWGVQYSIPDLPPGQLSSVQILWRPDSQGADDDGFFPGVETLFTVAFGPLFGDDYREYKVEVRTDDQESTGTGTVEVNDAGSTAVIRATGTTADGVSIDATVNCPSVTRASQ